MMLIFIICRIRLLFIPGFLSYSSHDYQAHKLERLLYCVLDVEDANVSYQN